MSISSGSGVVTIFFYKGLTRNQEIKNTTIWVLPNIWRLGWVRDTKFGTSVSNELSLNAEKWQDYSFYCFWVIKGKPTGCRVKLPPHPPPPTKIRVNESLWDLDFFLGIVSWKVTLIFPWNEGVVFQWGRILGWGCPTEVHLLDVGGVSKDSWGRGRAQHASHSGNLNLIGWSNILRQPWMKVM